MKLTLSEPRYLKDSISIISELVTETHFKVTKDSIQVIAMDPANVAMIIYKLLSSTFVEYDVKEETYLAMNLSSLKQVLRRAKPSDQLTLETEENKLKITLKGTSVRTFHLPLIDAQEKEQKIPSLNFDATITTTAAILNDAIEDVDIIGESVTFLAEEGKLTILSAGDLSKAKVDIPADSDTKVIVKDKHKSKYSIEYLKKMILGGKLADKVKVRFSNDYPLRIDYSVYDLMLKITVGSTFEKQVRDLFTRMNIDIKTEKVIDNRLIFEFIPTKKMVIPELIDNLKKIDQNVKYEKTEIEYLQLSFILAPRVDSD